ncbi:vacuolar cation/proton exchanger 1a [Iris pallida]|uniref:Vacuolar cation/proton exchanger 1a n=1 Tax=Iris pallida TaxID=29817 RepID=A0AAX6F7L5_IRIPA|nr:vacuolar cation/proton exchanger 1a [Iris pallida]
MLGHILLFIVPTSFTPLRLFSLILPSDVEGNQILNLYFSNSLPQNPTPFVG